MLLSGFSVKNPRNGIIFNRNWKLHKVGTAVDPTFILKKNYISGKTGRAGGDWEWSREQAGGDTAGHGRR